MKELLEDIQLSKIAYLIEKMEKSLSVDDKIKYFKKIENKKITPRVGIYLIENSTRNFNFNDNLGGINSSLIELCFKEYKDEYAKAISKVFKNLSNEAKDRVLYLLTTVDEISALKLYSDLVIKYYDKVENVPIGNLATKPVSYPYLFPKLYDALKFDINTNNILVLLSSYLNSGIIPKADIKKYKKTIVKCISNIFEKALIFKFKDTYEGLNNPEYKKIRYFLELAVNIEFFVSNKETKEYLTKLLKKNDNQLKLFILDNYFRKEKDISKLNFEKIAEDLSSRYALFELLTIYEKQNLMPKKYLSTEKLAESDFFTNFVISSSYLYKPISLKQIDKKTINGYDYYIYKFNYKYKYTNNLNDYLTNYICNQIGMDKYEGKEITAKFIGISGGYNPNKEVSLIEKNHKKLLISKLEDENKIDDLVNELLKEDNKIVNEVVQVNKEKKKKQKVKSKKERKKLFNKKEKITEKIEEPTVAIKENNISTNTSLTNEILKEEPEVIEKKKRHIFIYILLFLFAVFLGLLIYCILYIYGVGSMNDGLSEKVYKKETLKNKGDLIEIRGTEIFNQPESEYYVLLYTGAKQETSNYYTYINEFTKRKIKFYYVDLKNNENKFLYTQNDLNFIVYTDRLLKVKDKEYEYYVDGKIHILDEMQNQLESIIKAEKEAAKNKEKK